jgi:hypothetical protein
MFSHARDQTNDFFDRVFLAALIVIAAHKAPKN